MRAIVPPWGPDYRVPNTEYPISERALKRNIFEAVSIALGFRLCKTKAKKPKREC